MSGLRSLLASTAWHGVGIITVWFVPAVLVLDNGTHLTHGGQCLYDLTPRPGPGGPYDAMNVGSQPGGGCFSLGRRRSLAAWVRCTPACRTVPSIVIRILMTPTKLTTVCATKLGMFDYKLNSSYVSC